MNKALTLLLLFLVLLPATRSQEPTAPPAQPGEGGATDVYPSWVDPEPPCQGDPVPAAGGSPAAVSTGGDAATPQVLVEPAGGQERLAFDYDSGEGVVEFDYRAADASDHRMAIDFGTLREFVDADGDGRLDAGEEVLQSIEVAGHILHYARTFEATCGVRLQWVYLLTVTADDVTGLEPEEQAAFLEDKPRLSLRFTHLASEEGGMSPERAKIDIGIDDYAFTRPDSALAFSTLVTSGRRMDEGGQAVVSSSGGTTVGYTWLPTAEADGRTVPVHADVDRTEGGARVTLVYPHAASILHDPELGLIDVIRRILEDAQLDGVALAIGMGTGALLLAVATFTRRRWP